MSAIKNAQKHIYIYVCMCMCIYTHICMYVHTYIYIHTHIERERYKTQGICYFLKDWKEDCKALAH